MVELATSFVPLDNVEGVASFVEQAVENGHFSVFHRSRHLHSDLAQRQAQPCNKSFSQLIFIWIHGKDNV